MLIEAMAIHETFVKKFNLKFNLKKKRQHYLPKYI